MGALAVWALVGALTMPPSAGEAAGSAAPDPVAVELAGLNSSLKEIVRLLRLQIDALDLDLLLKRVQLAASQLADAERALQSAEAERLALERQRGDAEMQLRLLAVAAERPTSEVPRHEAEAMAAQVEGTEGELKRLRERLAALAASGGELESTIASRREELRAWQLQLDRRLAAP